MDFATVKKKLKQHTIGIAGCGGLGSNCAVALLRSGIHSLIIADFDIVSESNLNRQFFFSDQIGLKKTKALKDNLLRINPNANISEYDLKITKENISTIFGNCKIIIEAFDLAEMKKMLIETVMTEMPDKYIISGSGLAAWGNNEAITTFRHGNLIICGDMKSEVSANLPPIAPRVGIVANMQANIVLEILLGNPFEN